MYRSLKTSILLAAAVVFAVSLPMAACTSAPTANAVQAIDAACTGDALIRPTVTALLAVPGLATSQELEAVTAARALIDPICANPSATPAANAATIVLNASQQISAVLTALETRKAKAAAS